MVMRIIENLKNNLNASQRLTYPLSELSSSVVNFLILVILVVKVVNLECGVKKS